MPSMDTPITWSATEHAIEARAEFRTREEAEQVAALFPKSAKVRVTTLSTFVSYWTNSFTNGEPVFIASQSDHFAPEGAQPGDHFTTYLLVFRVGLASTGVTGAKNEGGLKRWASFKRTAAKHGIKLEYTTPYGNSLTPEEAEAL